MWSFGQNNFGQLGTGNTKKCESPQKVLGIPLSQSISCGNAHTLILTNEETILSFGYNVFGQLCLGNDKNQVTLQQTPHSGIITISAGAFHSLFQKKKGEIYGWGSNALGELGLGYNEMFQLECAPIRDQPPNIIKFSCGFSHSLFLDTDGNVFSVGSNIHGSNKIY